MIGPKAFPIRRCAEGLYREKRNENRHRGRQDKGPQARRRDIEAFESGEDRDRGRDRAIAVDQRGAKQSNGDDRRPLKFLDADQRHKGENAAFAVIVDAHRNCHVFHGRDDDQRPQDQREDAKDDVGRRRAAGQIENGLERIKRARPDVAKDDPERGQTHPRQNSEGRSGEGPQAVRF